MTEPFLPNKEAQLNMADQKIDGKPVSEAKSSNGLGGKSKAFVNNSDTQVNTMGVPSPKQGGGVDVDSAMLSDAGDALDGKPINAGK